MNTIDTSGTFRIGDWTRSLVFLAAIWLPLAGNLFSFSPQPFKMDSSQVVPRPPIPQSLKKLRAYPGKYQDFFGSNFGFRLSLIQGRSLVRNVWIPMSHGLRTDLVSARDNTSRHIRGKDSWFYLDRNGMFFDHMGLEPLSEKELNALELNFEERQQWFRDHGIYYLLVIVPDKQSIYPEYLPGHFANRRGKTRLDQIMERMDDPSRANILDLRPTLLAAKSEGNLYYKNDAHWNELGAYFAYQAIVDRISESFPQLKPEPLANFEIQHVRNPSKELLAGSPFPQFATEPKGIGPWYAEDFVRLQPNRKRKARLVAEDCSPEPTGPDRNILPFYPRTRMVKELDDSTLPKAVIFHDSFTRSYLELFLSEHFKRTSYQWYFNISNGPIEEERPDIVIEERVERMLIDGVLNLSFHFPSERLLKKEAKAKRETETDPPDL